LANATIGTHLEKKKRDNNKKKKEKKYKKIYSPIQKVQEEEEEGEEGQEEEGEEVQTGIEGLFSTSERSASRKVRLHLPSSLRGVQT
jgi:hypothetical protein